LVVLQNLTFSIEPKAGIAQSSLNGSPIKFCILSHSGGCIFNDRKGEGKIYWFLKPDTNLVSVLQALSPLDPSSHCMGFLLIKKRKRKTAGLVRTDGVFTLQSHTVTAEIMTT
jgi:hypothetical protein